MLRGIRRGRLQFERAPEMRAIAAATRVRSEDEHAPGENLALMAGDAASNVAMEGDNVDTAATVIDEATDSDTYVVGY